MLLSPQFSYVSEFATDSERWSPIFFLHHCICTYLIMVFHCYAGGLQLGFSLESSSVYFLPLFCCDQPASWYTRTHTLKLTLHCAGRFREPGYDATLLRQLSWKGKFRECVTRLSLHPAFERRMQRWIVAPDQVVAHGVILTVHSQRHIIRSTHCRAKPHVS